MRHLCQSLRRHALLNATIVATLALALSAAVVVTGLIDTFLLAPLPHLEDRGVMLIEEYDLSDGPNSRGRISWDSALDLRREAKSFSSLALVTNAASTVHGNDATEVAYVPQVSPEFFTLLGVKPALGEIITPQNAEVAGEPALVLSDSLWRRRFASDPAVLGRSVRLDDRNARVVGVLPPGFELPSLGNGQQAWLSWHPEQQPPQGREATRHYLFAKLARGVSPRQALTEIHHFGNLLAQTYPETNASRGLHATPLRDNLLGPFRQVLWMLLAMSVLVLLAACLNSGALLLAQALRRRREFAVRLALGARPGRLLRMFWGENLALTALAATISLLLSAWIAPALVALVPAGNGTGGFAEPGLRWMSWGLAVGAAVLGALLFGLMPWFIARRLPIDGTLRGGGRVSSHGFAGRLSRWLVTGQIALALALATGAALLVRSSRELSQVDYGFPTAELFQFRVGLRSAPYRDPLARQRFFENARAEIAALPGVAAASLASFSYPSPPVTYNPFVQEGDGLDLRESPKQANLEPVSPEFLQTHDLRLLHGRFIADTDTADHPRVAVISAALAERHWPGRIAVGERVKLQGLPDEWVTIVGVVSDRRSAGHQPRVIDSFMVPMAQATPMSTAVFVRYHTAPPAFSTLQRAVWALDPDVSLFFESQVAAFYADSAWQQRFSLVLIVAFAVLAVTLCATGLYALLAFLVATRTRELGVRSALGASAADLRGHVLRDALAMIGPGLALGLLLAFAAARGVSGLLYNVPRFSPLVFGATGALLTFVCLLAAWLPAHRATRVDPALALRSE